MGASESREHSHDHLAEEQNVTPIQNRRILKLQDPRSPSEQVYRTPIITDATDFQDPRSPTAEICRTPVDETNDPRSPSDGISRTPANPFIFPDPRSPSIGVTRTPLIKTIEEREIIRESEEHSTEVRRRKLDDGGDSSRETMNNNTNNTEDNRLKDNEDAKEKSESVEEKDVDTKAEHLEQVDTPQYEVELANMHLDESTSKEVQEDSQCATLVLTNSESQVKYRGNCAAKRSLKDNFQTSLTQTSRSPLSSRNVLQNSPSFSTTGTKHHTGGTTTRPTRLIGRYGPAGLDKENI